MNILLIDNNTSHIQELSTELSTYADNVQIKRFNEVDYAHLENIDLVILSGNSGIPYKSQKEAFDKEMEFIRSGKIPVIGICFGLKLIVYAFGGHAQKLEEKEQSIMKIEVIEADPIFENKKFFEVFEAHLSYIPANELGAELIPLAKSEIGIEIVKHPTKPVYGFQFHPEVHVEKNEGYKLLKNAILTLSADKI